METGFSLEVDSKLHVKNVTISDEAHGRVLFEGSLGKLEELSLIDGVVLEIRGAHGTLRVEIEEEGLRDMLAKRNPVT